MLIKKAKYKNVIVITHLDEIKDCVDKVISVSKTNAGISEQMLNKNPEAFFTVISMK